MRGVTPGPRWADFTSFPYLHWNHRSVAAKTLLDLWSKFSCFHLEKFNTHRGVFKATIWTSADWLLLSVHQSIEHMWNGTKCRTRFHNILDPKLDRCAQQIIGNAAHYFTLADRWQLLWAFVWRRWIVLTGESACQMSRKRRDRPHHEKNNDTHVGTIWDLVFLNKICRGKWIKSTKNLTIICSENISEQMKMQIFEIYKKK